MPTDTADYDIKLRRWHLRLASQRTFRGEIYDHNKDVPLTKGYANNGKPFNIEEACYLKPVFHAIKNPIVQKVVIRKAVQTLGTFVTEKSATYFIENDPGDMVMYDSNIEDATDHAKSRLAPLLKAQPALAGQIRQAEKSNRHDVTTTEFYLPGVTLRIWPLNMSSTQRFTARYVIIHDAFLSGKTGLITQAIARATQHPHDRKILIESQGSDKNDDFDAQMQTTNEQVLYVVCPYCETNQPFEWERERPADFVSIEPKRTCEGKTPRAGTYSGMIRGDASPDRKHGEIDAKLVLLNTHYECYHCGAIWRDVPEIRKQLDQSSNYIPTNPLALPENEGFCWPFWINRRLSWGADEYGMLAYLLAKKIDKETGNREPFRQWVQKRAAKTWDDSVGKTRSKVIIITDNSTDKIENEACRLMQVDCQQDDQLTEAVGKSMIGHFWYKAWAVDKSGKVIKQLARGYADSWEKWIAVRKALQIPNKNVKIDGAHWFDEVLRHAAKNWEIGQERIGNKLVKVRHVWTIMRGNANLKYRKHSDGIYRPFTEPTYYNVNITINGQNIVIRIPVIDWNVTAIKDVLYAIRRGGEGMPKIISLPREQLDELTRSREVGKCTYEAQITNEHRTKTKAGKDLWEELNPNTHYNDCGCMGIVSLMQAGLLGVPEAPAAETNEA